MRDPGRYTKFVTVERIKAGASVDDHGQVDESNPDNWEKYTRLAAKVMPRSSREFWVAAQNHANLTHLLRVPWSKTAAGIEPTMRLQFEGRTLNMAGPPLNVDEANREIELNCVERT